MKLKKLLALMVIAMMVVSFGACVGSASDPGSEVPGSEEGNTDVVSEQTVPEITDANEILQLTWEDYKATVAEDLLFPVGGGDTENMVMDAPGTFNTSVEFAQDTLTTSYCATPDFVAKTDDIATMMNMMMANNFTAAAYHISDVANVDTAVNELKEATLNNQWMCGIPETFSIIRVGDDYIVSVFGNGQVVDAFVNSLSNVYGESMLIVVEENLM